MAQGGAPLDGVPERSSVRKRIREFFSRFRKPRRSGEGVLAKTEAMGSRRTEVGPRWMRCLSVRSLSIMIELSIVIELSISDRTIGHQINEMAHCCLYVFGDEGEDGEGGEREN